MKIRFEYQLAGINQLQIKEDIGLTFAAGLRSFLRQDPDVIMVGEIRDQENCEYRRTGGIKLGHRVLSTLHTERMLHRLSHVFWIWGLNRSWSRPPFLLSLLNG